MYNVLRPFTDVGWCVASSRQGLDKLHLGDHHHIVCRSCDAIADVTCAVDDTPCLTAADASGYEIDEAKVISWGRCPECATATSVSSGEGTRTRSVRQQLEDTTLKPEQSMSRANSHQKATPREEMNQRA